MYSELSLLIFYCFILLFLYAIITCPRPDQIALKALPYLLRAHRQTDYPPRLHEKQVHVDRISTARLLIDTKGTLACPTPSLHAAFGLEVNPKRIRKKPSRMRK